MGRLKYKNINLAVSKDIAVRFVLALVVSLSVSMIIVTTLWNQNRDLVHSILELTSVCIGITTFLIIWSKREHESSINDILGFGFLIVSILDFMHTYYYESFIKNDVFKGELSVRFWLLARLAEVIILLIFSYSPYVENTNKHLRLIKTIIITGVFLCVFYMFPQIIPDLYNNQGVTAMKVVIEYLIIPISIITLFKLKKNLHSENLIKFKYLYICVLLIIPSELCFTLLED